MHLAPKPYAEYKSPTDKEFYFILQRRLRLAQREVYYLTGLMKLLWRRL